MSFRSQRVRDPLHNVIDFAANEFEHAMWQVIQTRPFQRLRRIKQLGLSELVYPGATHTRFAHSLGVFHTARQLMARIRLLQGDTDFLESRARMALAAALVHDVGHGPFSHAFEDVGKRMGLKMAKHELVSDRVIRDSEMSAALNLLGNGFCGNVADIISLGAKDIYCAVVSSQFDADRLDYMRRDRLMCGTQHGAIDYEWLVSNLEVGDVPVGVDEESSGSTPTFVLGPKAIYAAESYLLGLFQLYPTVYYHKTTRGAEKLFSELLIRVFSLVLDGHSGDTGLPSGHPLVNFALNPESLELSQALDDFTFLGALELMALAKDKPISLFATRIRDRKLLKAIEVFDDSVLDNAKKSDDKDFLNRIELRLRNNLEGTKDEITGYPRCLIDRVKRPLYKQFEESKGPLNQIMIKPREGPLRDVAEVSPVIKAIKDFEGLRVYIAQEDTHVPKKVREAVKEAIQYARTS
jgi:HD superfamily phosphohydrolase